jgi:DNA polymerase (family 10)
VDPGSGHPLVLSLSITDSAHAVARLTSGVLCDLYTTPPEHFGLACVLATGPMEHLALLRERGAQIGVRLEDIAAPDEAAFYRALQLPLLPAEVRDGTDEVAAAVAGDDFTDLIDLAHITAAMHCHTTYSDGRHSIEQMAKAALEWGLAGITITDHSVSARYAGGLTREQLEAQWKEIQALQDRVGIRLWKGMEADILRDGSLDCPDEVFPKLDVVFASIHVRHRLDTDGMTQRLLAAMRAPVFKIWGHPLGRLIARRPPIPCRFEEVLDAICQSQAAIEINGDPHRLDLDPERARRAHERGISFVLGTDAHSIRELDHIHFAVGIARRARIRRRNVLNALPPDELAEAMRPVGGKGRPRGLTM